MEEPKWDALLSDIRSVVSREVVVDGDIDAGEDLRIEGTVTGRVRSTGTVVVEASASVKAGIQAANVVIRGRVDGDIEATAGVEIDTGGRLNGDCTASAIRISEGAVFEGRSNVRKP